MSRNVLLPALAVSALAFLVFLPSLNYDFVNWDDMDYVTNNIHIRSLDRQLLGQAFSSYRVGVYLPLTQITYALDFAIWGLNPKGYHLTNIIWHSLNTLLVIVLAARLLQPGRHAASHEIRPELPILTAVLTGILFGLHPLHVESVVWVSERKDVVSTFFFLLSLLAYCSFAAGERRTLIWYIVSLAAFILSLLSKPMAVTLPLVLLMLDMYPLRRLAATGGTVSTKRILIEKMPFVTMSMLVSAIAIIAQQSGGAVAPTADLPVASRLLIANRAAAAYLWRFFYPLDLAPFYPILLPVKFSAADAAAVFLTGGLTVFAVISLRTRRVITTTWMYYIVTLLPVIGIIQVGGQASADRYTYVPLLGPMFLMALGIVTLILRLFVRKKFRVISILLVTVFLAALLIPLTRQQMGIWRNSLALWNRELSVYPRNVPLVYRLRADAHFRAGDLAAALTDYTAAIDLDPADYRAYSGRGLIHFLRGDPDSARTDFGRALEIRPDNQEALYYLGLLGRAGKAGT